MDLISEIKSKFDLSMGALGGTLYKEDIENISSLLEVGEYKVAFEILCDIMGDEGFEIENSVQSQLIELGRVLKVDDKYISEICNLPTTPHSPD